nr:magnetosome protein Mad28-1 [Desulfobacteraceae bacterium]
MAENSTTQSTVQGATQSLDSRLSALKKEQSSDESSPKPKPTSAPPLKPTPPKPMAAGIQPADKAPSKNIQTTDGPVGLDIGTSHIVVATVENNDVSIKNELNAFYPVELSKITNKTLQAQGVPFFEYENQCYTLGYASQHFANIFHSSLRRPISGGIVSSNEHEGIQVIQAIIESILPRPVNFAEALCFGVPGEPLEGSGSVVYHTEVLKRYIGSLGYRPIPVNEGMAVVMSELEDESYTGIGISFGGGMCNVCLSYLSVPVITFSIRKGGDYVNQKAGESVGEPETKMKLIKEEELDLSQKPSDRYHMALHIFYEDMITSLIKSLQKVISASDRVPRLYQPIPIILSGGSVIPNGFLDKFNRFLKQNPLPIEISRVGIAANPLETTARGALKVALAEKN